MSVLGRVLVLWCMAVCFIFAGMVGTGLHLFAPPALPESTRFVAGLVGWPSAVLGPVVGIIGILRVLTGEKRALVVCKTGLRLEGFGGRAPIAWSDLQDVALDGRWPRQSLVLRASRQGQVELIRLPAQWIGISARALCDRLRELQRRALLGVVRPI